MVIPGTDYPSEPCYESETVKFLQEVKDRHMRCAMKWAG